MLVFFDVLVLPHAFVGDVDAIAAEGDDGVDVGLEGVADGDGLCGCGSVIPAETTELMLVLVGCDDDVVEHVGES